MILDRIFKGQDKIHQGQGLKGFAVGAVPGGVDRPLHFVHRFGLDADLVQQGTCTPSFTQISQPCSVSSAFVSSVITLPRGG